MAFPVIAGRARCQRCLRSRGGFGERGRSVWPIWLHQKESRRSPACWAEGSTSHSRFHCTSLHRVKSLAHVAQTAPAPDAFPLRMRVWEWLYPHTSCLPGVTAALDLTWHDLPSPMFSAAGRGCFWLGRLAVVGCAAASRCAVLSLFFSRYLQ